MKKMLVLSLAVLIASALHAEKKENCSDDGSCIVVESSGTGYKFQFRKKDAVKGQIFTVTFTASDLVNLKSADAFPVTRVVNGPGAVDLTLLSIVDSGKYRSYNYNWNWQYGAPASGPEKDASYLLPFAKGKRYRVLQGFNGKVSHFDETKYAVDFRMNIGEEIHAARGGIVIATENRQEEGKLEWSYRTKSNYVLIQHDDGSVGRYYHLVKGGVKVRNGQAVKAGDLIGLSGNSGYSDVPHLHFEVSRPVDGNSKITIPFTFVTDFGDREVPVQGIIYSDTGVKVKERVPVYADGVVFCKIIKDGEPQGVISRFTQYDTVELFIPFNIPGAYAIAVNLYNEQVPDAPFALNWGTEQSWWYTTYTLYCGSLEAGQGNWKADVFVDGVRVKTIEFVLE